MGGGRGGVRGGGFGDGPRPASCPGGKGERGKEGTMENESHRIARSITRLFSCMTCAGVFFFQNKPIVTTSQKRPPVTWMRGGAERRSPQKPSGFCRYAQEKEIISTLESKINVKHLRVCSTLRGSGGRPSARSWHPRARASRTGVGRYRCEGRRRWTLELFSRSHVQAHHHA